MKQPTGTPFPLGPRGCLVGIVLLTLLAGLMRFAGLNDRPAGLFRDEAEKGYNAWALATTSGVLDLHRPGSRNPLEWNHLPFMIDVTGTRTSAIYHYASVPFIWMGGLTPGTTRAAAAAAGTLTVLLAALLIYFAWGAGYGLVTAAVFALCPWHLIFSRWALQGIFVPLFIVVTLWGMHGFERGKRWGLPLAGAALGMLFYAYSGAQPFVAAWGLCLVAIYGKRLAHYVRRERGGPWLALAFLIFLVPLIPTVMARLAPGGSERMGRIAIWSDPSLGAFGIVARFVINYLQHLNPVYLFFTGDGLPRHNVPFTGQLSLTDVLFLPLGLVLCRRKPLAGALYAALLCGPIPAALTNDGIPHALRSFAMMPACAIFIAGGVVDSLGRLARRSAGEAAASRRLHWGMLILGVLTLAPAAFQFKAYWQATQTNDHMLTSFEAGQRWGWERIVAERTPGQRIYVDATFPYAPYFQLFYLQPDPRQIAAEGFKAQDVYYIDPRQYGFNIMDRLKPGDWLVRRGNALPQLHERGFKYNGPYSDFWAVVEQK